MLKYVREQLAKAGVFEESAAVVDNDVLDDDMFTEAAHVLEELSDLSTGGTEDPDAVRKISGISIPVEDDFEIDTVEFCMTDGRMSDIPGDAALQESYYKSLKSKYDFYQEAVDSVIRLPRESEDAYEDRVYNKMNSLYNEYMEYVVQEGMFGFGEIKLSDPNVVWNIHLCFGKLKRDSESEYNASLPVSYEAHNKKILKKQLECIKFWDYSRLVNAYDDLTKFANEHNIRLPKDGNIWDVFRPDRVCVPREPKDAYKIFIVIKNLSSGEDLWFAVEHKIKDSKKSSTENVSGMNGNKQIDLEIKRASAPSTKFVDKKAYTESYIEFPSRWGNVFQEAINFGGAGDPPPLAGTQPQTPDMNAAPPQPAQQMNPPMPSGDDQNAAPPTQDINVNIDNGENPPEMNDQNADLNNAQPADPPAPENPNVNDVTDRIADGVNDALAEPSVGDDIDLSANVDEEPNFDVNSTSDDIDTTDMSATDVDPTNVDSPDSELPDDTGDTDMADADFDNMTLNQLIEQAQEKAKDMTIDQLKAFLMDNTLPDGQSVGNPDVGTEEVQESVFKYSKTNINDTLDVLLRKALGILNNDKYELSRLLKEFRRNGKQLNKALNRAVKYETIYDEHEKKQLQILNRCLCDLMSTVKDNSSPSNTQIAKRLIKAFCSQAKAVGVIIDKHKQTQTVNESVEEDVSIDDILFQEGAITALFNVRENLQRKATYVQKNVTGPIVRKANADKLTIGYIKSYFKTSNYSISTGSAYGYDNSAWGTSISRDIEDDNPRTRRLLALKSLGEKIERKERKRAKFTDDELENLDRTIELASELYDDICAALKLDIDSDTSKLIVAIENESRELNELCKKFKK
jgi:hypothetical protein